MDTGTSHRGISAELRRVADTIPDPGEDTRSAAAIVAADLCIFMIHKCGLCSLGVVPDLGYYNSVYVSIHDEVIRIRLHANKS